MTTTEDATAADRPLTGPEAAALIGISYDLWKYYKTRGRIPPYDGVELGRKYWLRSTVLGLAGTLAGKPTHEEIVTALAADGVDPASRADRTRVAADLGVHERTVYRHAVAHARDHCEYCPAPHARPAWMDGLIVA